MIKINLDEFFEEWKKKIIKSEMILVVEGEQRKGMSCMAIGVDKYGKNL